MGVDDDNAIHSRFDNRAPPQLHGPPHPMILSELRDVARDERSADHVACRIQDR